MIDNNELLPPGQELGGFRIESHLGHGNMGIIYRAIQINLNRPVALKVLFKRVAADQEFVRSFFREAQAAAAFTHQNIVQAFDVGQSDEGIYYFAMELIEGGDIEDRLREEGPYAPEDALNLVLNIADGLDYGSSLRKLTHGDIKPANIMLTKTKKPKLADLGLARMGGEIQGESDGIMLTPLYAAPEMIQGQWEVGDPRADMYSLGATLYHMITGSPPFQDDDYRNVIDMQVNMQHTSLYDWDQNIPLSISKLVDRLLEKDPDKRFDSWDTAKKAMVRSLEKAHVKESRKKKKVLHYQKSDEYYHKKKKSKTPLLIILLLILGIAAFAAVQLSKETTQNEYQQLLARMRNDSTDDKILKLEDFISRQGSKTPDEAKRELQRLLEAQNSVDLFSFNTDLLNKELKNYEDQVKAGNPAAIKTLLKSTAEVAKKLNKYLPDKRSLYIPFDESPVNMATFLPSNGISTKGSPKYVTGKIGKAVSLNGDAFHYGDLPETRFSRSGSFTISFWLNPAKLTFPILGKCEVFEDNLNRGYLISLNNGRIQLSLYGNGTENMMDVISQTEIQANKWAHIAVQYSKEAGHIFINGKKQDVKTSSTLTKNFSSSGPLVIGFKNFSGSIDDVMIWRGKITNSDISKMASLSKSTSSDEASKRFQNILHAAKVQNQNIKSQKEAEKHKRDLAALGLSKLLHGISDNPHNWKKLAEEALEQSNASEFPLNKLLSLHLANAKSNFVEALRRESTHSKLTSNIIPHPEFRDLKIHAINKDLITFSYQKPYGLTYHKFYLDEKTSKDALELIVKSTLNFTPEIYKESISNCLAALIISEGEALPELISIVKDDRQQQLLRRIAREMN